MSARRLLHVVPPANLTPNERAARAETAFRVWLAEAETAWLECRARNRHDLPGLTDERTALHVDHRLAVVEQTSECPCGTSVYVSYDLRGEWLTGERGTPPVYSWPDGYLLPHELTGAGGGLSPARRAAIKAELRARALDARGLTKSGKARRRPS